MTVPLWYSHFFCNYGTDYRLYDILNLMSPSLILYTAFIFKHFIADFPMQTHKMGIAKANYGNPLGLVHALIHGAFTFVILFSYSFIFEHLDFFLILALALFDILVHYHVDWLKASTIKRKAYTAQDFKFWVWTGFDQMLHYLTYIAIVACVS